MWTADPDGPVTELHTECVRHGGQFSAHPDAITTVWLNAQTMTPLRPDGTPITPREPGTFKGPLCQPCARYLSQFPQGGPVADLFPRARLDAFTLTEPTP